jgi:hypothetical protein
VLVGRFLAQLAPHAAEGHQFVMIESKNRRVDKDTSVRDAIEEERDRDRRWRVNYGQFSASRREQVTASEAYV